MAWPPGALPVNRTDATPQQTTHAADHNAIGGAVNDTVDQLKLTTAFAQTTNGKVDTLTTKVGAITAAQPLRSATGGAGVLSTVLSSPVTLTLPDAGLYLIGYTLTIDPTAAGWGYADAQVASNGGLNLLPNMMGGRWFEQAGVNVRQNLVGMTIAAQIAAGETIHLRGKTFAASVPVSASTLTAYRLLPAP